MDKNRNKSERSKRYSANSAAARRGGMDHSSTLYELWGDNTTRSKAKTTDWSTRHRNKELWPGSLPGNSHGGSRPANWSQQANGRRQQCILQ